MKTSFINIVKNYRILLICLLSLALGVFLVFLFTMSSSTGKYFSKKQTPNSVSLNVACGSDFYHIRYHEFTREQSENGWQVSPDEGGELPGERDPSNPSDPHSIHYYPSVNIMQGSNAMIARDTGSLITVVNQGTSSQQEYYVYDKWMEVDANLNPVNDPITGQPITHEFGENISNLERDIDLVPVYKELYRNSFTVALWNVTDHNDGTTPDGDRVLIKDPSDGSYHEGLANATFGPASGVPSGYNYQTSWDPTDLQNEVMSNYHMAAADMSDDTQRCIHWDSWATIIKNCREGKAYLYKNCVNNVYGGSGEQWSHPEKINCSNSCTKTIPIHMNDTIFNVDDADGGYKTCKETTFYDSVKPQWLKMNYLDRVCPDDYSEIFSNGYVGCRMRSTFIGSDKLLYWDGTALQTVVPSAYSYSSAEGVNGLVKSSNCLLSCLPDILKQNIYLTICDCATSWNNSIKTIKTTKTIADPIWLPSASEMFNSDKDFPDDIDNSGNLFYDRHLSRGAGYKDSYTFGLYVWTEDGNAAAHRLRSVSVNSNECFAAVGMGNISPYRASLIVPDGQKIPLGFAFGFCL